MAANKVMRITALRDRRLIEMLRHFLQRAESGRLRGCGLFADDIDAGEQHCVAGSFSAQPALGSTAAMRMSIDLAQVDEHAVSGWAP